MAKNNEYASVLPKKILLSVFLFGLVLLAGRVLYSQFDGFSACFAVAPEESAGLASVSPQDIFAAANSASRHEDGDFALRLYRSEKTRDDVLEFFTGVTGDAGISEVILRYADANNISPSLAFALSWEESRFQPGAVNRKTITITLLDEEEAPAASWQVINAWPMRYTAPDFNATSSEIAIETLEIAHEGMTRVS